MALTGSTNAQKIYNYLYSKIANNYGVCGLMGNLKAESALNPKNLQQTYEKSLGYTDDTYTAAVDNGTYTNFVKDSAGYGLAQWTYWSRKQNLLNYAKSKSSSIGDLEMQLEFLIKELGEYNLLTSLKNATSVLEASNIILLKFEKPASMNSASTQSTRASYGESYYKEFASSSSSQSTTSSTSTTLYRVRKSWSDTSSQKGAFSVLENAKKCADNNPGYSVYDEDGQMVYTSKSTEVTSEETSNYNVGDKVIVNGTIYANGNGGNSIKKSKATMYVVSLVDSSKYKYYIGVSNTKGGTREGWASPEILSRSGSNDSTNNSSTNTSSSSVSTKTASDSAASKSSSLAGSYKTTADLNMRNGAGTSKSVLVVIPKGTVVRNYGYYTTVNSTKWLYVQVTLNNIKYTGFCSSAYLTKV